MFSLLTETLCIGRIDLDTFNISFHQYRDSFIYHECPERSCVWTSYMISSNEDWFNWISSIVISYLKLHKHFPIFSDMYAFLDDTIVKSSDENDVIDHWIEGCLDISE